MKVVEKTIQIFVSSDGNEFATKAECLKYETEILNKIKYFCVSFDFDLCEGRGWINNAYLAVIPVRDINPNDIAFEYALEKYGHGRYLVSGVQGYGAEKTFHIREVTKEVFDRCEGITWTSVRNNPEQILLSPFEIKGFANRFCYTDEWHISY